SAPPMRRSPSSSTPSVARPRLGRGAGGRGAVRPVPSDRTARPLPRDGRPVRGPRGGVLLLLHAGGAGGSSAGRTGPRPDARIRRPVPQPHGAGAGGL